ncbi:MAG: hydantoinase B/oxoprolinase family protein, partial [Phycisphaerae bacterium]
MTATGWQFFIDVGGTFTDVIALSPEGRTVVTKVLSSSTVRCGNVDPLMPESSPVVGPKKTDRHDASEHLHQSSPSLHGSHLVDPLLRGHPQVMWLGYQAQFVLPGASQPLTLQVQSFDSRTGTLTFDGSVPDSWLPSSGYSLISPEPAPVLAVRLILRLPLAETVGTISIRLGTTRATNALLERKGSPTAFVTTCGFGDLLRIGNQDRPELFALHIKKRDELAEYTIEVDERLDAHGHVIRALDEVQVRTVLKTARHEGIESLGVSLLHAHVNPVHEELIACIAADMGFGQVTLSSAVSGVEGFVSRSDTTVADAYLGPVIRSYLGRIRTCLPDALFSVMTSFGGLVPDQAVHGKDCVMSGPAGGVVGCAWASHRAGFDRAIGFDMGGTSTDVSKVEAPPEPFDYQHETVKADVRFKTPMLAIETVAAGGGSLCSYDGQRLTVGPESAGAFPGPACYGRGGPLTVTDMNLIVGRIVPSRFPFRLDEEVVRQKLDALIESIHLSSGRRYDRVALAEGFLKIANEHMATAIKRISLQRGYDVRDYALCSFGGAGSQHACAIATALGMKNILISPYAGVLSAAGIASTTVRRFAERTCHLPLTLDSLLQVESLLGTLREKLNGELRDEGLIVHGEETARCVDVFELELAYAGQASTIKVAFGPLEAVRDAFLSGHRRLYGYVHDDRDVTIASVRTIVSIKNDVNPLGGASGSFGSENVRVSSEDSPKIERLSTVELYHGGSWHPADLLRREAVQEGQAVHGPAIIVDSISTIVVDPGWVLQVNEYGDIILSSVDAPSSEAQSTSVDPVRLELFNRRFAGIAEQMGATLQRTALSTNVKERLDYSCALFTAEGRLVVNAPHIPVHLGAMSECVTCLRDDIGAFKPGDVYVTNHPYRGGSHLNDVTVVTPVFDRDRDELLFIVASRAHHAEIGGTRPGSMPPFSVRLSEEGVLIDAFRWIENDIPREADMRALLTSGSFPSRNPDENLADLTAQVAANQRGVEALLSLIDQESLAVVQSYMSHIQDAASEHMQKALRRFKDGNYTFEDALDDGSTIRLCMTIDDDRATVDFSGTDPVHAGNLNANRAIVTSAVIYCLRCMIDEDIPLNAGVLDPVTILLPDCFLNPETRRDDGDWPALVGGNVETSQRIVDCILGALRLVAASQGTMNNVIFGNERFGYYETIGGGSGAGADFAGADAVHCHMTNTRLTDPEILEVRYPVRLHRFAIRRGSGGAGVHRGGDGMIRELE